MKEQLYGGLDIHKDSIAGCILDEHGTVIREHKFPVKQEAAGRFTEGIPQYRYHLCHGSMRYVARDLSDVLQSRIYSETGKSKENT